MIFTILGLISAGLFLVGDWFYLRDTVRGVTLPQRTSWGIAVLMNVIDFSNQLASGATSSLPVYAVSVVMVSAIFLASLKHGIGGYHKKDIFTIFVAALGIAGWILFSNPLFSILSSLVIAISIKLLIIDKAKRRPETETRVTWLFAFLSAGFNVAAVGQLDYQLFLLPVTSLVLNGYMVYLLYSYGNRRS